MLPGVSKRGQVCQFSSRSVLKDVTNDTLASYSEGELDERPMRAGDGGYNIAGGGT